MDLKEFLYMGGYAEYVWSAFGLTLVVLLGNVWLARRRFATARLELARRLRAANGTS
jgi:heme exporter protein CcmD